MNDFSFVIQADESSALELQLGRFISTAAPQVAALTGPQNANLVLSGPASGVAALPSYRQLVTADLAGVTLPVLNGGTGATTAANARTNLSAAKNGANSDITSLSGLTTALSVSQGGTGANVSGGTALDNISGFASTGYVKRTGAGAYSQVGTIPISDGGTGATTQAAALSALLASSLIPVANGGTNASTASGARSNLGAAASGTNSDITSLSGLTTALSIAQGGTAATTASAARTNLGLGTIATQNASAVAITGGSVDGTPVGATTASTGKFTTLQATGAITPSPTAGIVGTTTNDNASAGSVGEYISSTVLSGSAVSLTSSTAANVTSISLTAGDWEVSGGIWFNPAASTTASITGGWVSTTSATIPTAPNNGGQVGTTSDIPAGRGVFGYPTGVMRLSLSSTTTVYLTAYCTFGVSTMSAFGIIRARRVR